MTAHSGKFLPRPRPETEAWWVNCRDHKLMIQHCSQCRSVSVLSKNCVLKLLE